MRKAGRSTLLTLALAATLTTSQSCTLSNGEPQPVASDVCGRYQLIQPTDAELLAMKHADAAGQALVDAVFAHNDKYLADCP